MYQIYNGGLICILDDLTCCCHTCKCWTVIPYIF